MELRESYLHGIEMDHEESQVKSHNYVAAWGEFTLLWRMWLGWQSCHCLGRPVQWGSFTRETIRQSWITWWERLASWHTQPGCDVFMRGMATEVATWCLTGILALLLCAVEWARGWLDPYVFLLAIMIAKGVQLRMRCGFLMTQSLSLSFLNSKAFATFRSFRR